MSETVHYKGTATKIYQDSGKTVEEMAMSILNSKGITQVLGFYDNAIEYLCDEWYEEYFFHPASQSLFKITKETHEPDEEIINAKKIAKDTFEYELRYYNGGAGFSECLEEALNKVV
jgi:hypothetical protein